VNQQRTAAREFALRLRWSCPCDYAGGGRPRTLFWFRLHRKLRLEWQCSIVDARRVCPFLFFFCPQQTPEGGHRFFSMAFYKNTVYRQKRLRLRQSWTAHGLWEFLPDDPLSRNASGRPAQQGFFFFLLFFLFPIVLFSPFSSIFPFNLFILEFTFWYFFLFLCLFILILFLGEFAILSYMHIHYNMHEHVYLNIIFFIMRGNTFIFIWKFVSFLYYLYSTFLIYIFTLIFIFIYIRQTSLV
jgi:hypothetical protein